MSTRSATWSVSAEFIIERTAPSDILDINKNMLLINKLINARTHRICNTVQPRSSNQKERCKIAGQTGIREGPIGRTSSWNYYNATESTCWAMRHHRNIYVKFRNDRLGHNKKKHKTTRNKIFVVVWSMGRAATEDISEAGCRLAVAISGFNDPYQVIVVIIIWTDVHSSTDWRIPIVPPPTTRHQTDWGRSST